MKFGKKSAGAVTAGLSLAMVLTGFAPTMALAAETAAKPATPTLEKVLDLNSGSTVNAKFTFQLTPHNGIDGTETNTVEASIGSGATKNTLTIDGNGDATGDTANKASEQIRFGQFPHAGVYVWEVSETASAEVDAQGSAVKEQKGTFQNSTQKYYLVAVVNNATTDHAADEGQDGVYVASYNIFTEAPTASTVDNVKKLTGEKTDKATFENKYTEKSNTGDEDKTNDGQFTIKKTVTGNQASRKQDFSFTVTFTAPTVKPTKTVEGKQVEMKDAEYFASITLNGEANKVDANGVANFTLRADQTATFGNVIAGTKYTVAENKVPAGYTAKYGYASNGTTTALDAQGNGTGVIPTDAILIGETPENKGVMTNAHSDITPTGIVMNNMPFIVMAGAAVAGVVAYGSAKRKLEK